MANQNVENSEPKMTIDYSYDLPSVSSEATKRKFQKHQNREKLLTLSEGPSVLPRPISVYSVVRKKSPHPNRKSLINESISPNANGTVNSLSKHTIQTATNPTDPILRHQNWPKMGIRDKKYSPFRQNSTINNSESSLQDKLANALKALKPGSLSQSTSSSSPFKNNKNAVVEADDVIYYSNSDNIYNKQRKASAPVAFRNRQYVNQRKSKSVFAKHSSPSQHDLYAECNSGQILKDIKSLDQIKQLYKSVPDFSTLEDEAPHPGLPPNSAILSRRKKFGSNLNIRDGRKRDLSVQSTRCRQESPVYAVTTASSSISSSISRSPTDSGYRSGYRGHINTCSPPPPPTFPPPPLPTQTDRPHYSFVDQNANIEERNSVYIDVQHQKEERVSPSCSAMHEPTIVQVNGDNMSPINSCPSNSTTLSFLSRPTIEQECLRSFASLKSSGSVSSSENNRPIFPIDDRDVLNVLQKGRCKDLAKYVTVGVVPRLTSLIEAPLMRISNEIQRFSYALYKCTINDVRSATMVSLPIQVAQSCIKAGIQATAIYALSGTGALKTSMSQRAGLHLSVGKFYRWMIDTRVSDYISDSAVIYFVAVIECIFEEFLLAVISKNDDLESLSLENFTKIMYGYHDLCHFFDCFEAESDEKTEYGRRKPNVNSMFCARSEAELRSSLDRLYRHMQSDDNVFVDSNPRRSKNALYFGKQAISALFYFIRCDGWKCPCQSTEILNPIQRPLLSDWLRLILIFVDHRFSSHVEENDILQTARILVPNVDCPPCTADLIINNICLPANADDPAKKRRDIGFNLIANADTDFLSHALTLLGPMRHRALNDLGLTALAQGIVVHNEESVDMLLANRVDVNYPVPNADSVSEKNNSHSLLSPDFAGWSPLTWAVAQQDVSMVNRLIDSCADVEESYMVKETPIQVAAALGDLEIATRLINCGANPYLSTINYDSLKCNFRNFGAPSALALAATYGNKTMLGLLISKAKYVKDVDDQISLSDFLNESQFDNYPHTGEHNTRCSPSKSNERSQGTLFETLSKHQQKALNETLYYAIETARFEIAMELQKAGLPWNVYTWTKCLQISMDYKCRSSVQQLLGDFSSRLVDELTSETMEDLVSVLFEIIHYECRHSDCDVTASSAIISRLYNRFSSDPICAVSENSIDISQLTSSSSMCGTNIRPIIDPKYVDNPELSDIRFKIDGKVVYGHRIVLVNASDEFKRLLDNPSGFQELTNVSYNVFKLLMEYLYGNNATCIEKIWRDGLVRQLEVTEASLNYGISQLTSECYRLLRAQLSHSTCTRIYKFAQRIGVVSIMEDCEIYMLRHFSSLAEDKHFRALLDRSSQSTSSDLCASLANRLIESFVKKSSTNRLAVQC